MCNNALSNIDCYYMTKQQQALHRRVGIQHTIVISKESKEESLDDKIIVILNVCQKLLRYV